MGVHYFKPDFLGMHGPAKPESERHRHPHAIILAPSILIYEPQENGSLELVAVENLAFAEAWKAAGKTSPPTFHGVDYNYMADDPATPADDAHQYRAALRSPCRAIYRENPSGVFAPFNPAVSCAHHKGKTLHADTHDAKGPSPRSNFYSTSTGSSSSPFSVPLVSGSVPPDDAFLRRGRMS